MSVGRNGNGLEGKTAVVTAVPRHWPCHLHGASAERVRVAVADIYLEARNRCNARRQRRPAIPLRRRERDSVAACFAAVTDTFGGYDILCATRGLDDAEGGRPDRRRLGLQLQRQCARRLLTNQAAVRHFIWRRSAASSSTQPRLPRNGGRAWLAHYSASNSRSWLHPAWPAKSPPMGSA